MEERTERLKKLVEDLISQGKVQNVAELSERLGYSKAHLSMLLSGKKPVNSKFADRLQEEFPEIDVRSVLRGNAKEKTSVEPGSLQEIISAQQEHIRLLKTLLEKKEEEIGYLKKLVDGLSATKGQAELGRIKLIDNHDGGITILNLDKALNEILKEVEAIRYSVQK